LTLEKGIIELGNIGQRTKRRKLIGRVVGLTFVNITIIELSNKVRLLN
jgi:hypothetical protein